MSNTEFVARNGLTVGGNTRMTVPVGNTGQRPSLPRVGDLRYNTDIFTFEGYSNGTFSPIGGTFNPSPTFISTLWGNSTANVFVNSTAITVSDPTKSAVSNTAGLFLANSTLATSLGIGGLLIGANVLVNSSSFGLGNSTVSFIANSTWFQMGNSSVTTTMNSSTFTGNVVVAASYTGAGIGNTLNYWANTPGKLITTDGLNQAGAYTTLIDAPTIAWDMSTGINFVVTLGGNRTLGNPTNPVIGRSGVLQVNMDATGSRTLSFGNNFFFDSDVAPVIGTGAGKLNFLFYHYFAANKCLITLAAKAV